jgi:hypothetical protein
MLFVYIIKNVVTFAVETVLFNSIWTSLGSQATACGLGTIAGTRTLGQDAWSVTVVSTQPARGEPASQSTGGRNMAKLVLVNSVTGFVHNVLLLTYTIYILKNPKPTLVVRLLQFCGYFSSTLRHSLNFLLFYFFNTSFRKEANIVFIRFKLLKQTSPAGPSHLSNSSTLAH